jgi:hypothetical protein
VDSFFEAKTQGTQGGFARERSLRPFLRLCTLASKLVATCSYTLPLFDFFDTTLKTDILPLLPRPICGHMQNPIFYQQIYTNL